MPNFKRGRAARGCCTMEQRFDSFVEHAVVNLSNERITGSQIRADCLESGDQLNSLVRTASSAEKEALHVYFAKSLMAMVGSSRGTDRVWPTSVDGAVRQCWEDAISSLPRYAAALARHADSPAGISEEHYVHYLSRCILARVHFVSTSAPSSLADAGASAFVSADDVANVRRRGFCVIQGAMAAAGVDATRLHAEMAQMHAQGGIPASRNECNPGAHGTLLRAGARSDLHDLERRGIKELPRAIRFLQGLVWAFQQGGYGDVAMQVPPQVLASAYPPEARYKRHLDSYGGHDNARQLTFILYANPHWDSARDGGCLCLEAEAPSGAVEVPPLAGTLVCFESARVFHAVLPSKRLRFALTLWVWHGEADSESCAEQDVTDPRLPQEGQEQLGHQHAAAPQGSGAPAKAPAGEPTDEDDDDDLKGIEVVRCAYCTAAVRVPMRCGKCKRATYCDRRCQAAHWKEHKKVCGSAS